MWLIRAALRRPLTILVAVIAVALTAGFAINRMRADIFPDLDLPVIYVAQPFGGMKARARFTYPMVCDSASDMSVPGWNVSFRSEVFWIDFDSTLSMPLM